MVELVRCQCPNCNAELQLEPDRETAFCSYCGTKIIIADSRVTKHYETHRIIDDAAIRRADAEYKKQEIREKVVDHEISHKEKTFTLKKKLVIGYIVLCMIMLLLSYFFIKFGSGDIPAIVTTIAVVLISLPIVIYLSKLILKHGQTTVTEDTESKWFGLKKNTTQTVHTPAGGVALLWLVYLFVLGMVYLCVSLYSQRDVIQEIAEAPAASSNSASSIIKEVKTEKKDALASLTEISAEEITKILYSEATEDGFTSGETADSANIREIYYLLNNLEKGDKTTRSVTDADLGITLITTDEEIVFDFEDNILVQGDVRYEVRNMKPLRSYIEKLLAGNK